MRWTAAIAIVLTYGAWAGEAEVPAKLEDPMEWVAPTEKPALVERVTGEEFLKRKARAQEILAKEEANDKGLPARGLLVDKVGEGGPAAVAGIAAGDIILRLDGRETIFQYLFNSMRTKQPQRLEIWSRKERAIKEVTIQPGRLGIWFSDYRNIAEWNFNKTPADPKWEANVRLARVMGSRDPDLAETFLFHALKDGCPPTQEMDALAARILYSGWRYNESMKYDWLILKADPQAMQSRANFVMAAWLLNKYPVALEMCKEHPDLFPQLQTAMELRRRRHVQLPPPQRLVERPFETAKRLYWDSLLLRSVPVPNYDHDHDRQKAFRENTLQRAFRTGQIRFRVDTGQFSSIAFGPGVQNIFLSFNFKAETFDAKESRFTKHFTAGLMDLDAPDANALAVNGMNSPILGISCDRNTYKTSLLEEELSVLGNQKGYFEGQSGQTVHRLKLAVWNGRVEMELDGRTIYYGPLHTETGKIKNLGVVFKCVGFRFDIWNLQAYELMDEPRKSEVLARDINTAYRSKYTRIHNAAEKWDLPSTKELLKYKPDLTLRTESGEQPIHCSARTAEPGVADALLAAGAKLDIASAAALGKKAELKELLAATPKPDLTKQTCGWSAMHGAALSNDAEIVLEVLKGGAEINAKAGDFFDLQSPLMWAAMRNKVESTKTLLERGADVNQGERRKMTALWFAEENKHTEVITLLKAKRAVPVATEAVRPPEPPPGDF